MQSHSKIGRPSTRTIRHCLYCGSEFESPPSSPRKYCSMAHANLDRGKVSMQRFWDSVDKRGADECWPWLRGRNRRGYGQARTPSGKWTSAPRVAWELTHGPIPEGLFTCHTCDNPPCCNPAHLWLGSAAENQTDMATKGRAPARRQPEVYRELGQRLAGLHRQLSGEAHHKATVTEADVREIRRLYAAGGVTYRELAQTYNTSITVIYGIVKRRSWRTVQ